MTPKNKGILVRYGKFLLCNIPGTAVDLGVVWIFANMVFNENVDYWGPYVLSPAISYECGILVDFVLCYFFVWGERVGQRGVGSFFRHMLGYNLSSIGAYISKALVSALIGYITTRGLGVVWCDLIALTFSGTVNFVVNERFIFRKKKRPNNLPTDKAVDD